MWGFEGFQEFRAYKRGPEAPGTSLVATGSNRGPRLSHP